MKIKSIFIALLLLASMELFSQQIDEDLIKNLPAPLQDQIKELNIKKNLPEVNAADNTSRDMDILIKQQETVSQEISKMPIIDESNKPFGYDFFENAPSVSESMLDIPLQSEYRISFRDKLTLMLTGSQNDTYELDVNLGGEVLIPSIGQVSLKDLTLYEADEKIKNIVKNFYVGTNSDLSIRKASLKKISVIGAVKKPGTFVVNPFISISEAISYAGGLVPNSSLRTIEVLSPSGEKKVYDLYSFLIEGNRKEDVNLKNGDTLVVGFTDKFIDIQGEVKRPGVYEYVENDSLEKIIGFSEGLTSLADKTNIFVNIYEENKLTTTKASLDDDLKGKFLHSLYVGNNLKEDLRDIQIKGSGVKNIFYDANGKNTLLEKVINELTFTKEIYPFFAIAKYQSKSGKELFTHFFNLNDRNSYKDIVLQDNVELTFFSRNQVLLNSISKEDYVALEIPAESISILNFGTLSYEIPLTGKFKPAELFNFFGPSGNYLLDQTTVTTANENFFSSYEKEIVQQGKTVISFPIETDDFVEVSILGEVETPGKYLVSKNSTLNDLYELSGGFLQSADLDSVFLSRESIKELEKSAFESSRKIIVDALLASLSNPNSGNVVDPSVLSFLDLEIREFSGRVSGNLRPNSELSKKIILENGDNVFIPSVKNTVSVYGQVLQPVTVLYQNFKSVDYYIELAGGLSKYADSSEIFILKSNGVSVKVSRGLFTNNLRTIEPGDMIVIPRDLDRLNVVPAITAAAGILSDLALSAASLNAISN